MHSEVILFTLFRNNVRCSLSFYIYRNLSDCRAENERGLKADTYLSMFAKFSHGDYNDILFIRLKLQSPIFLSRWIELRKARYLFNQRNIGIIGCLRWRKIMSFGNSDNIQFLYSNPNIDGNPVEIRHWWSTDDNDNYPISTVARESKTIHQSTHYSWNNSWYPNVYRNYHTKLLLWFSLFRWE